MTIFKVLNLLQYRFYFMFCFFGHKLWGILAPWPGTKPITPALKGKALTPNTLNLKKNCYVKYIFLLFSRLVLSDSFSPMDCSQLSSSVHEISQARILEWVVISFSRGSSWLRDQTSISCVAHSLLHCRQAFFFNWRIIALQHFVVFCRTST